MCEFTEDEWRPTFTDHVMICMMVITVTIKEQNHEGIMEQK
jgi:hypothetical protein